MSSPTKSGSTIIPDIQTKREYEYVTVGEKIGGKGEHKPSQPLACTTDKGPLLCAMAGWPRRAIHKNDPANKPALAQRYLIQEPTLSPWVTH